MRLRRLQKRIVTAVLPIAFLWAHGVIVNAVHAAETQPPMSLTAGDVRVEMGNDLIRLEIDEK